MNSTAVKITQVPFGAVDLDGKPQPITKFILTNQKGGEVHIISLGAAVTNLMVPDKHGSVVDVVLGFQDINGEYMVLYHLCTTLCYTVRI